MRGKRTMRTARTVLWVGIFTAAIGAGFGIEATVLNRAGAQDLSAPGNAHSAPFPASSVSAACAPAAKPAVPSLVASPSGTSPGEESLGSGVRLWIPAYPGPQRPPQAPLPTPVEFPTPIESRAVLPAPSAQPAVFSEPSPALAASGAAAGELEPSFTVFPGVIRAANTSLETPRYHVRAGTFATRQDALALGLQLESLGYSVTVFDTPPYRVRVGGYVDRTTAERLADHLRKAGFNTVIDP